MPWRRNRAPCGGCPAGSTRHRSRRRRTPPKRPPSLCRPTRAGLRPGRDSPWRASLRAVPKRHSSHRGSSGVRPHRASLPRPAIRPRPRPPGAAGRTSPQGRRNAGVRSRSRGMRIRAFPPRRSVSVCFPCCYSSLLIFPDFTSPRFHRALNVLGANGGMSRPGALHGLNRLLSTACGRCSATRASAMPP